VDDSHLPPFDKHATSAVYDRWYGQRMLDRSGTAAAYALGHGLSYTSFAIEDVAAMRDDGTVRVTATVRNTGDRPGGHVVQVYAQRPSADGADRFLAGFARVEVAPGGSTPVDMVIPQQRLSVRQESGRWTLPPGSYRFDVGASAADPAATRVELELS
jgi:beta-glucosidase